MSIPQISEVWGISLGLLRMLGSFSSLLSRAPYILLDNNRSYDGRRGKRAFVSTCAKRTVWGGVFPNFGFYNASGLLFYST